MSLDFCPVCSVAWQPVVQSVQGDSHKQHRGGRVRVACSVCDATQCQRCSFVNHPSKPLDPHDNNNPLTSHRTTAALSVVSGNGCCQACGADLMLAPARNPTNASTRPALLQTRQRQAEQQLPVGRVTKVGGGGTQPQQCQPATGSCGSTKKGPPSSPHNDDPCRRTCRPLGLADDACNHRWRQHIDTVRRNCRDVAAVFIDPAFDTTPLMTSSDDATDTSSALLNSPGTHRRYVWAAAYPFNGGGLRGQKAPATAAGGNGVSSSSMNASLSLSSDFVILPTGSSAATASSSGSEPSSVIDSIAHFIFGGKGGAGNSTPQKDSPSSAWWLIDPVAGVSAAEIVQGELGDCWLLSAIAAVAHYHPQLIAALFVGGGDEHDGGAASNSSSSGGVGINDEGVVGVRLWADGEWHLITVSCMFPAHQLVATNHPLQRSSPSSSSASSPPARSTWAFGRCRSGRALWVPLLEKAYAKWKGGYHHLKGGRPAEALGALTGMPCIAVRLQEGDDHDVVMANVASFLSSKCLVCACCGGTPATDHAASLHDLKSNHAYAVLSLGVNRGEASVRLRNPWGSLTESSRLVQRSNQDDDWEAGCFWLPLSKFFMCFSEFDVCLTYSFMTEAVHRGICISTDSDLQDHEVISTPPSQTLCIRSTSSNGELILMVTQSHQHDEQRDAGGGGGGGGFRGGRDTSPRRRRGRRELRDIAVCVLRWCPPEGRWIVHAVSPGACEPVVVVPGIMVDAEVLYAVVVMSVNGGFSSTRFPAPPLSVTVLSELSGVQVERFTAAAPRAPPLPLINELLYRVLQFATSHQSSSASSSRMTVEEKVLFGRGTSEVRIVCGSIGVMYLLAVVHTTTAAKGRSGNESGDVAEFHIDLSSSEGLATITRDRIATTTDVTLPFSTAAIVAVAAPLPNDGVYQVALRYESKIRVHPGAGGGFAWVGNVFRNWADTLTTAPTDGGSLFSPFKL